MNTRTNIVLDDELIAQAMARAGVKTKKAAVDAALKAYVRKHDYSAVLALRGKGLVDPNYDPRGLYGLTETALEQRGLKTRLDARVTQARHIGGEKKAARTASKAVGATSRARRKPLAPATV